MKIKVGIDARHLSENTTGIGRYVYEITHRLTLNHPNVEWHLYSHRKLIIGNWDSNNIFVHTLNIKNRLLRMLWAQIYLPLILRVDGIIIFWSPAHRIPSLIDRKISKVVTIHDFVWKYHPETMRFFSRYLDRFLMPIAIEISDKVICVSNSTRNDIIKTFPELISKLITIYEAPTVLPNIKNIAPNNIKYILFVGTLEPRKNLKRLLMAMKSLLSLQKIDVKLYIAGGSGWGKERIEELIIDFDLSDHVKLLGYVDDFDLANLYKNALFTVMPSLYEGFGLPILESYSYGTPVLTSNNSSMLEIGGKSAHYVDPFSVDSIKEGLQRLLNDQKYLQELKAHTTNEASKYSWNKAANETYNCLMAAMDKK